MRDLAITGPKTANGIDENKIAELNGPRARLGTNSPMITGKLSWPAAAMPLKVFAAINVLTSLAVAPMMQPISPITLVPMMKYRRPKMSDRRPTSV